jgi:hypothetical protein
VTLRAGRRAAGENSEYRTQKLVKAARTGGLFACGSRDLTRTSRRQQKKARREPCLKENF